MTLRLIMIIVISIANPITIAVSLITASILLTPYLYKNLARRWIPLVLILTFSSGIITLFIYTASLASNETNKRKKKLYPLLLILATPPLITQKKTQIRIKTFSAYNMILILGGILVITLMALTSQAHNPNQTLTSSF
jgi:anaerobic C4-dicarboxylate transporter